VTIFTKEGKKRNQNLWVCTIVSIISSSLPWENIAV
jgi:hypothetical protein